MIWRSWLNTLKQDTVQYARPWVGFIKLFESEIDFGLRDFFSHHLSKANNICQMCALKACSNSRLVRFWLSKSDQSGAWALTSPQTKNCFMSTAPWVITWQTLITLCVAMKWASLPMSSTFVLYYAKGDKSTQLHNRITTAFLSRSPDRSPCNI